MLGNIKDMLVSALMKKGVLFEARNYEMEFEIPNPNKSQEGNTKDTIKIKCKADHVRITVEKE
ncbi:MAG: hypothetical protein K0S61_96 [Anaerocolumna sp.]|jgi:hypothetical protein|nr:hypothetical protein [Anaerocolumna sp.]